MEMLDSTNAHGKVPFSTGSDFPSITTQAFTAILPASFAAIFLDVDKHYSYKSYTQFKNCFLSFVWSLFYRNPFERAGDRRENMGVKIACGGRYFCLFSHVPHASLCIPIIMISNLEQASEGATLWFDPLLSFKLSL